MEKEIEIIKKELKQELDKAISSIKIAGYYSEDVENFYLEIIKKLDKLDLENFNNFFQDLENKSLSFLEQETSSDRLALINRILQIFPMSKEIINKIVELVLSILEKELEKGDTNALYGFAIPHVNLRLCCISILLTVSLFRERFEHFNLNEENYKYFFKIADIIEKSKNEQVVIKKEMLKIRGKLTKNKYSL